jgi:hypothetical protein
LVVVEVVILVQQMQDQEDQVVVELMPLAAVVLVDLAYQAKVIKVAITLIHIMAAAEAVALLLQVLMQTTVLAVLVVAEHQVVLLELQ